MRSPAIRLPGINKGHETHIVPEAIMAAVDINTGGCNVYLMGCDVPIRVSAKAKDVMALREEAFNSPSSAFLG